MTTDRVFNISEAARVTGKSIPTIHSYLKAGKLPNAITTTTGKTRSWRIPLTDLVMAGLLDAVTQDTSDTASANSPQQSLGEIQTLRERLARLEAENEQLKERVKDSKEFLKAFQYQLETRQAQDARRRSWWPQSNSKTTEPQRPATGD